MAAKKAQALIPPAQSVPSPPSENSGQSYEERVGKGRKEYAFWLDGDSVTKIQFLLKKRGFKFPKEVFAAAIDEMYARYMR